MFCHFWGKFENTKWPPFLGRGNFLKIAKSAFLRYLVGRKFVFFHFGQKFENSKWPPYVGMGKFFENCRVHCSDTLWVENFDEIALSHTVKEQICVLLFLEKIQNGRHFLGGGEIFFENCKDYIP